MSRRQSVVIAAALVAAAAFGVHCDDDATTATSSSSGATSTSSSSGVSTSTGLADMIHVTGVVTDGENPVEGASVLQGGMTTQAVTGPDGRFDVVVSTLVTGIPTLVAAKEGYRSAGLEIPFPDGDVTLVLRLVAPPDATGYAFGDPGTGDPAHDNSTAYCGHCHTSLVAQFQTSAHARATRDPWVQDVYAGTALALDAAACAAAGGAMRSGITPGSPSMITSKCYVGVGVLPDLNGCGASGDKTCDDPTRPVPPTKFGGCADCHAPGIVGAGPTGGAGGHDLHEATGIAYDNGNHCDVCHKIARVDLAKPPGLGGRLALGRPHDKQDPSDPTSKTIQAMFGPLKDVPNFAMGGVYTPHFEASELCAGCHEDLQPALAGGPLDPVKSPDGLPVHTTYSEWKASSFGTPGTTCQFCHMPTPLAAGFNSVDVGTPDDAGITFGFARPPEDQREHTFLGPLVGTPRLIDAALTVSATATQNGSTLDVDATVANTGAGHAIPTGEPMRGMVLLVRASCGAPLTPIGGQTISDVGGARGRAVVGTDATFAGAAVTWSAGAAIAKPGDVVRVVRPTGTFDDYVGNGWFAGAITSAQKGIPILEPVGEALVVSSVAGTVTLSGSIAASSGDVVYLGDAVATLPDGAPSLDVAGAPGNAFAKVLVDPAGARLVPHHRAVDIASDNRVPPQKSQTSHHAFELPVGCTSATVDLTLLYRPAIGSITRERGWDARSYVVGQDSLSIVVGP